MKKLKKAGKRVVSRSAKMTLCGPDKIAKASEYFVLRDDVFDFLGVSITLTRKQQA